MRKDDQRGEEEAQKVKVVGAVGGSLLCQSNHNVVALIEEQDSKIQKLVMSLE